MTTKVPSGQPAKRPNTVGRPAGAAGTHQWLLLVHQLPAKPSNVRVRTWRRLQQLGAVAVKQGVYALPDSPSAREDFEWLKTEIEGAGGQATLFTADTLDTWSSDEVIEEFRRARENDYTMLSRAVERALTAAGRKRAPRQSRRAANRIIDTFRQQLAAIEAIDFFGSAGRDRVVMLVSDLQRMLSGDSSAAGSASPKSGQRDSFHGRMWVTRPRPGIDRMGSAWLIRRFIDPEARFGFVDQPPTGGDAVPFDMFGVEFSHRGEWCTFETLVHTFSVSDSAVDRLAAVVHDLDLKDARFGAPETSAVGALVEGLQALYPDDHVLLDTGMTMFEALYRAFERATRHAGPRPVAGQRRRHPKRPKRR